MFRFSNSFRIQKKVHAKLRHQIKCQNSYLVLKILFEVLYAGEVIHFHLIFFLQPIEFVTGLSKFILVVLDLILQLEDVFLFRFERALDSQILLLQIANNQLVVLKLILQRNNLIVE